MDDNRSSRAETETALGCASRDFHPSEDLSELPLSGQEYQRWCCHRKTDRPWSAFWTVGPASHLTCRVYANSLHRWIFALPPMSLPVLCLYKAHQRMYFSFWIFTLQGAIEGIFRFPKKLPHYLSSFASPSGTKPQKLPIMSNNILSFDRILLRCLLIPLWDNPTRFA